MIIMIPDPDDNKNDIERSWMHLFDVYIEFYIYILSVLLVEYNRNNYEHYCSYE